MRDAIRACYSFGPQWLIQLGPSIKGNRCLAGAWSLLLKTWIAFMFFPLWNNSFAVCSSPTKQILLFMLFRFFLLIWQAIHHGPKSLGAPLNKDKNRGNGVQWDSNRKSWHRIYIALFRFCLFSIKLAILDIRLNQGYSFVSVCK